MNNVFVHKYYLCTFSSWTIIQKVDYGVQNLLLHASFDFKLESIEVWNPHRFRSSPQSRDVPRIFAVFACL